MSRIAFLKEPDGPTYHVVEVPPAGGRDLGLVRRERHQSRRTNATGWRWYFLCGCHGYTANPPDGHGFETRKKAGEALAYHMARERQGLPA